MEHEVKDKGSKMEYTYKFKVNDKVKITPEAYATWICLSVKEGEELHVTRQTSWLDAPAYYLQDTKGTSKGLFTESEIEPFDTSKVNVLNTEVKKPKEHSAQTHTKTMWGLVYKNSNFLDQELFTTRELARRDKRINDLEFAKVVKVILTWEG